MKNYKAVFFDIDGVLIDSLESHLQFCNDRAKHYDLNCNIPNASDFRNEIVGAGKKISPMVEFFKAVGFPESTAKKATIDYTNTFSKKYTIKIFDGIAELLETMAHKGITPGYVTSNIQENVESVIGEHIKYFHEKCRFSHDSHPDFSKAQCIKAGLVEIDRDPHECIYIGDQVSDWIESQHAGTDFLGVTYGWEISMENKKFPTANSPLEIQAYVLNEAHYTVDHK